jgi:hypothetical protein
MTTTPEQIEAVARALAVANGTREDWWRFYEGKAIAVIAFMRPFIRAEVLEEAADVVGEVGDCAEAGAYINAIRALKDKP